MATVSHNQRKLESKATRRALITAWASLALIAMVAATGDSNRDESRAAAHAMPAITTQESVQTAGLLVPKRVRLIIKYQRTALA